MKFLASEYMGIARRYHNKPYSILWRHTESKPHVLGPSKGVDWTFILHTGKMGFRIK